MGPAGKSLWTYFPLRTIPRPLDVVWCRFPLDEVGIGTPGSKTCPALVRGVLLNQGHTRAFVEVTYGTSRRTAAEYPLDLHITASAEMAEAGLSRATCFALDRVVLLPWCREFFTKRDDGVGPIIGHLSQTSIMQLEALKVIRRQGRRMDRKDPQ